jgi:ATP-dependent DNA ligase/predicted DNA-binding WGR domain protein
VKPTFYGVGRRLFHLKGEAMIRLECTTGGHNKFYEFHVARNKGRISVRGLYGAIGQAPKEAMIYDGDSEAGASNELNRKQTEKLKKGYVVVASDESAGQPSSKTDDGDESDLPVIWPMNAQGIDGEEHLDQLLDSPEYAAQEKLDGMRAVVHVTPAGLRIFSRNAGVGNPFRPLEKTSSLPHLAHLQFPKLVGTVLDCEILAPGKASAEIAGMVNSTNGSNGSVHIYAFDILQYNGQDWISQTQERRLATLKHIEPSLHSPYVKVLPWYTTRVTKRRLYDAIMSGPGEGVMFKNLSQQYITGGRPRNVWWKFKKTATFDCIVMGFTKGKGKYNTAIGAIRFGQYRDGQLVELGQASGMSDQARRDMSINSGRYLGKVVTIKGQERLKSGAIRHPQFVSIRTDKKATECIWYENEQ